MNLLYAVDFVRDKCQKGLASYFLEKYAKILVLDCEIHSIYGRNPAAVFLEKTPTEYFGDSTLNKIYLIRFSWTLMCSKWIGREGDKWD